MKRVTTSELKQQLSKLLDAVIAGQEVAILRHGKPVALLTQPVGGSVQFPDRSALRQSLPACREPAFEAVRADRHSR